MCGSCRQVQKLCVSSTCPLGFLCGFLPLPRRALHRGPSLLPAPCWSGHSPWVTRGQRQRTAESEGPHTRAHRRVKHRPLGFCRCDLVAIPPSPTPPPPAPMFRVMVLCTKALELGIGKARSPFSLGTRQWRNVWCRLDVMNWHESPRERHGIVILIHI